MMTQHWSLGNESVLIAPFLQVNDYLHLLKLALAGACITELPPFIVQEHLPSGRLKALLHEYPLPTQPPVPIPEATITASEYLP
jgi:DNA-binding transcriptional LysR family regulator